VPENANPVTSQVRVENLPTPGDYIPRVMEKVRPLYLQRTYEIASWTDPLDFLTKLAIRSGKLLRVHPFVLFIFFFKYNRAPRLLMIWW
jgi:hypothetical protein